MSFMLIGHQDTDGGVELTFLTENGLECLEGSIEEVARLSEVMAQTAALAPLNDSEHVWLDEVRFGNATVKFGLKPDGEGCVLITRE